MHFTEVQKAYQIHFKKFMKKRTIETVCALRLYSMFRQIFSHGNIDIAFEGTHMVPNWKLAYYHTGVRILFSTIEFWGPKSTFGFFKHL